MFSRLKFKAKKGLLIEKAKLQKMEELILKSIFKDQNSDLLHIKGRKAG